MTDEREGRAAARDAIKQSHYHSIHGNREGRCSRPLKADACLALSSLASSSRRRFRCDASGMSPRPPTSRLLSRVPSAACFCSEMNVGDARLRKHDFLFIKGTSTRSTRTAIPPLDARFPRAGTFEAVGCSNVNSVYARLFSGNRAVLKTIRDV